jgi:hypothetical protein
MRRFAIISMVGFIASLGLAMSNSLPAGAAGKIVNATSSKNLILNGGAEAGTGSPTGAVVPVPHWTDSTGNSFTAVKYGATGSGFPTATSPGPKNRGANFFAGGPNDPNDSIVATQTVNLASYVKAIKGGGVTAKLVGWLGGSGARTDEAFVEVDFKNSKGFLTGTSMTLGPVTETQRGGVTELLKRMDVGTVPKGARTAYVQLSFSRESGQTYNDAFADDISLVLSGL